VPANTAYAGNSYYVALNGSDSNDGSIGSPWRNPAYALYRAGGPGNTIYVRGGRYEYASKHEVWIRQDYNHGGTNGQYFALEAYPGETVELVNVRIIVDAPWVRVRGFRNLSIGIDVVSGVGRTSHVEILDNTFESADFGYGAITLNADDSLVAGNTINVTGRSAIGPMSHGIYVMWGRNNVVRNNNISGATGYGIHIYDENKYPGYTPNYSNLIVEGNFITGALERSGLVVSGATGVTIDGVIIRNNIIAGNNHVGILVGTYGATVRNVKIFNNVLYQNGVRSGVSLYENSGGTLSSVTIENNIFEDSPNSNCQSNCGWFPQAHISTPAGIDDLVVRNNLYYPADLPLSGVSDPEPIYGNPLFVNPVQNDFHLQAGSPAIDEGLALAEVPTDKDGVQRPQGLGYDLGAYEYESDLEDDTTLPTVPTGLTAIAVSSTQINLSWTASTDNVGVTGYRIYRDGSQITTTAGTSYQDTGRSPSTTYTYRVAAYDAAGNASGQSTQASATTSAAPDTQSPTAPKSLKATVISSTQINLSWSASTDDLGVAGYKIYLNNIQIGTTANTSYQSTGLNPNTSYSYRVAAYDAAGNTSAKSLGVTARTQPSPSTVFTMGDRVQTTWKVTVRSTPSNTGTASGTQLKGAMGRVVGGPSYANLQWWWQIDFDSGADGWVPQGKLKKVTP
jgi:chitodextrinase